MVSMVDHMGDQNGPIGLSSGSSRNLDESDLITPPPNQPLALSAPHRQIHRGPISLSTTVCWSTHRLVRRPKGPAAIQRYPVAAMRDCDFPFHLGQYHKAAARHYCAR